MALFCKVSQLGISPSTNEPTPVNAVYLAKNLLRFVVLSPNFVKANGATCKDPTTNPPLSPSWIPCCKNICHHSEKLLTWPLFNA